MIKFLPRTAIRTLSMTLVLFALSYLLAPSLFSQDSTNPPVQNIEQQEKKEVPPANENQSNEGNPSRPSKNPGLVDLFLVGGWSMWPLLLASIIALGVALERFYFFFTSKLISKGYNQDLVDAIDESGLDGGKQFLESKKEEKISVILTNGMDVSSGDPELFAKGIEREAAEVITVLEKGLSILASVSTIAPLVGFLGTVSGMINAFDAIANADQVNAKVVAGGIKEALITTAAGLIVAIPAMAFYQILSGKVNSFAADVEEAANRIYKEFLKKQAQKVTGN